MKLLRLFLFAALCFGAAGVRAQNVTKTFRNETLRNVLKEVERQTKMSVIYKVDEVNANKKVTATFRSTPVREVLSKVLDDGLDYEIDNRMITIHRRDVQTARQVRQNDRNKTVKGQVLDEKGEPVIGATIKVKGTTLATVSDVDGNFAITVPEGSKLTVSYLGYADKEIAADQSNVTVSMLQDEKMLGEVVVTALGIQKEAKALSYNVQQINNDQVTGVKDASFMNALSGKVAGVEINSSSSGIGGGVKVVMRGAKSISNNNNALYVIDGIPMPSLQTAQPSDYFSGQGQSGDGASMINPEDIEAISVLSGAAASALYGSEAQNGVIMIKTRRGQEGRTTVTYSNNTSFFSPFVTPEFQNTYGAAAGEFSSWGDKLGTPSSYDPLDFYQTGYNVGNSVTLSTGTEKNQTFVSLASTNAEGIVQNNTLARYNFAIRNSTSMLNDKLHLDLSAMYMNIRENNMVSEGQYMNPIVPVYLLSPSYSLETYQLYEMYNESRNFKTQYWPWGNQGIGMQNPYWITNRDNLTNHKNRFMVSGGLTYDIVKGLSLAARAKMDYTSARYEKMYSATTDGIFADKYGYYGKDDDTTHQLYGDVMLNFDKYFGDFSLTGSAGASIQDIDYKFFSLGGNLNSVPNEFSFNNLNVSSLKPVETRYHDQVQSLFATAQVGWQSKLYLDLTGRIDWASALAWTDAKSVAYPSVGLTAILTDLIPGLKNNVLSFLKLRGSYSEVGNAPKRFVPYQTYPFQSGTPSTTTTYPNNDIKPERTKAWEVGMESHFWGNKVNLNVSLYKTSTFNQLFNPMLPSTSGYKSIYINGGRIDNKGIEVSLTLNQPLGPVDWSSTFTYSLNRNKVVRLLKPTTLSNGLTVSQDHLDLVSLGNVKSMIKEGGSMGDLYVTALNTDFHGFIDVDFVNNTVSIDHNAGPYHDGYIYAGNSQAKYRMGWRNSFSWKGLSLGFLINARVGGVGVSMTQAMMDNFGTSKASADARDAGGVYVNGGLVPAAQKWFQTVGAGAGSMYVYSATNVRLAELSLGYDVPITQWVPWIKGLNLAFTGRNLLMFYCKSPFDPELTASTGTGFDGMDYFMLPSLRNLGFSVRVKF
ncbi:SusC/RagA family TonB-linked outer membrane protein [Prevotella sp. kh1p2]|uniref:SusC/RagA family TonB-linked outer membrane protein n=1 Tax=Prevotella sp. kh1p2 TaxID=1761883 RepID=UPI00210155EF|nr:SusC/RagA family TonB-linked outer membrane protein [Prevotella sp. kh1p2]